MIIKTRIILVNIQKSHHKHQYIWEEVNQIEQTMRTDFHSLAVLKLFNFSLVVQIDEIIHFIKVINMDAIFKGRSLSTGYITGSYQLLVTFQL